MVATLVLQIFPGRPESRPEVAANLLETNIETTDHRNSRAYTADSASCSTEVNRSQSSPALDSLLVAHHQVKAVQPDCIVTWFVFQFSTFPIDTLGVAHLHQW
jgi:hypothetical protein